MDTASTFPSPLVRPEMRRPHLRVTRIFCGAQLDTLRDDCPKKLPDAPKTLTDEVRREQGIQAVQSI